MAKPGFAYLDGKPCRYTVNEAWVCDKGWREVNPSEVAHNAHVASEGEYHRILPFLPPLPRSAFHAKREQHR